MSDYIEKFIVTAEPTPESGECIGVMNWYHKEEDASAFYDKMVQEVGDTNIIAMWNSYIPAEWDADTITDYFDDTFMGETPEGFPMQAYNTPHEDWPHVGEDRD